MAVTRGHRAVRMRAIPLLSRGLSLARRQARSRGPRLLLLRTGLTSPG